MPCTAPATRLFVDAGLAVDGAVLLDQGQAHRLRHVLRMAPGDVVAAFNPRDGEFACEVAELGRRGGRLSVRRLVRSPAPEPDLRLLFAPVKRARLDWLIEKGAELGVSAFIPVWTERTQPERLNAERLQAHAVAAAEQSERLSVPTIRPPERLDRVLGAWGHDLRLYVCDESGGGAPAAAALAAAAGPAALLVGPEGGFSETELDAFGNLPFVTRIGLGPRVLRAETAALAAVAVFQAIAGDWRRVRSG